MRTLPAFHSALRLPIAAILLLAMSACGGGSGGGSSAPAAAGSTTAPGGSSGSSTSGSTGGSGTSASSGGASTTIANQTVSVGQGALFSASVSNATSYQWYKNGVAISGATASVYETPPIAASDAGAGFDVVVATAAGNVTSNTATVTVNPNADGSPPSTFWGTPGSLPAATQVMTFSFINQTNGTYPDSQLFWQFAGTSAGGVAINELHSFADAPTYDMPAVSSARMYFYIAPNAASVSNGSTSYYDFIEFNLGRSSTSVPYNFNGDTTRVDAFGLKTAIRLHCSDGTDVARGEDYGTFLEDRSITFLKFQHESPTQFVASATQAAPYRIIEPGAAGFGAGGANADYYTDYINTVWANNAIDTAVVPKPTPFLDFASNQQPDLSAALERHVADKAGTFDASGHLVDSNFWSNTPSSSFYPASPANFYAKYWHSHGIAGLAYGFPYDDVGGHSSDIGCNGPSYLVVAIGW